MLKFPWYVFFLLCKSCPAFIYRQISFLEKPLRILVACIWILYFDKKLMLVLKHATFKTQTRIQPLFTIFLEVSV